VPFTILPALKGTAYLLPE